MGLVRKIEQKDLNLARLNYNMITLIPKENNVSRSLFVNLLNMI